MMPTVEMDTRETRAPAGFYTHELTEYQRYKNLGVPDGQNPSGVWDNTHAASLEDYAIHEGTSPIYHPDAP
ncbi:hypothetical protein ABWH96_10240 [Marivirga tractuosa]|uniref:hypothetical protein n=1 Tax=Marivirga tractuosa TaxID=1006 RepID=UPI0035D0FBBB